MAGGGGLFGGGGSSSSSNSSYNAAAARQNAEKQAARNAVNAAFGIAPSMDGITPAAYTTTNNGRLEVNPWTGFIGDSAYDPGGTMLDGLFGGAHNLQQHTKYDKSAYDENLAAYNKEVTDAAANKDARDALYDRVRADAFGAGKTSLDESKTTAARNNKFALFAQGLNGGSQDIDENALLGRTYDQGLLDLGSKADSAEAGLRAGDESARLGLLTSIDNGMDQSNALTSALNQMKTGADQAEAAAKGTNLGDLFATAGLLYTKSAAARGAQAGNLYFNGQYPQYAAQLSGGKGGGIVTSTGG
jgi:hypothetical protein